jgi:hypothetical protein
MMSGGHTKLRHTHSFGNNATIFLLRLNVEERTELISRADVGSPTDSIIQAKIQQIKALHVINSVARKLREDSILKQAHLAKR